MLFCLCPKKEPKYFIEYLMEGIHNSIVIMIDEKLDFLTIYVIQYTKYFTDKVTTTLQMS